MKSDDALIIEDATAAAHAAMNRKIHRPSPEAAAAIERRLVRRLDNGAALAHAVFDGGSATARPRPYVDLGDPTGSREERLAHIRRALAINDPDMTASQIDEHARIIVRIHERQDLRAAKAARRDARRRARAEIEPKAQPRYSCARCNHVIAPDDKIYCAGCSGDDGADKPRAHDARDCSNCGEPVGMSVYCERCATGGDDDGENKPRAAKAASRATARLNTAHIIAAVACTSCNAPRGEHCRTEIRGAVCYGRHADAHAQRRARHDGDYYQAISTTGG